MKNLITIGLPSKGRLKEGSIDFLEKNNLKLTSNGGERNYFAEVEKKNCKLKKVKKRTVKKNTFISTKRTL